VGIMLEVQGVVIKIANFYLDCETTSLSPTNGEIITIQYQKLDFDTKEAVGPLVILKAWESSEKEILEKFKQVFGVGAWDFVAHGYNLKFEDVFLRERCIANGVPPIQLFSRPTVDLHPIGIMMNGGAFKGSGLDKISGKNGDGALVIEAIEEKNYPVIEAYIRQEGDAYVDLLVYLTANMYKVLNDFQTYLSQKDQETL